MTATPERHAWVREVLGLDHGARLEQELVGIVRRLPAAMAAGPARGPELAQPARGTREQIKADDPDAAAASVAKLREAVGQAALPSGKDGTAAGGSKGAEPRCWSWMWTRAAPCACRTVPALCWAGWKRPGKVRCG